MKKFKKIMKIILSTIITIAIIGGIFLGYFIYATTYKGTTISKSVNPDNKYTIKFQEVGEVFMFSPSKVRVTLLNNKGEKMNSISESIYNDGVNLSENNITVQWFNGYVEIILSGCEQANESYRLDFN